MIAVSSTTNGAIRPPVAATCDPFTVLPTTEQKKIIQLIFSELQNTIPHAENLRDWGKAINNLHPLRFCAYICKDPKLRRSINAIFAFRIDQAVKLLFGMSRWDYFIKEFTDKIELVGRPAILEDVPHLAEELKMPSGDILAYFCHPRTKVWEGNMQALWLFLTQDAKS